MELVVTNMEKACKFLPCGAHSLLPAIAWPAGPKIASCFSHLLVCASLCAIIASHTLLPEAWTTLGGCFEYWCS